MTGCFKSCLHCVCPVAPYMLCWLAAHLLAVATSIKSFEPRTMLHVQTVLLGRPWRHCDAALLALHVVHWKAGLYF